MDKVPSEVLREITQYLDAPLSSFATVSSNWQQIIEARTMAEVHLRSDNVSEFESIVGNARRRVFLKKLRYHIVLPTYSVRRWKKLPGRREGPENNAVFTRDLRNLFMRLRAYQDEGDASPLSLEIKVTSPMDSYQPSAVSTVNEGTGPDRNNNTYISFDSQEPDALPTLQNVFELRNFGGRDLHPTSLGLILRALPAVEKLYWHINGPDVRYLGLRREIRTSLARALSSTAFFALRDLELNWEDADFGNHSRNAGSLLNPGTSVDELSVALRKIAQLLSIRKLQLTGKFILSHEIFLATGCESSSSSSVCPSLEYIKLDLSTITPNGNWYYTGDPDSIEVSNERTYDSEEEEEFIDSSNSDTSDYPAIWEWQKLNGERPFHPWRNRPDPTTLNTFLLHLALAIPKMPSLRHVEFSMRNMSGLTFEAEYLAADIGKGNLACLPDTDLARFDQSNRNHARWKIVLTNGDSSMGDTSVIWQIPDDLKQAWKRNTEFNDEGVIVLNGGSWSKGVVIK